MSGYLIPEAWLSAVREDMNRAYPYDFPVPPPSRSQRLTRRARYLWRYARMCVALWIAPELDPGEDDW